MPDDADLPDETGLAPQPEVALGMRRPDLVDDGRLRVGNATRGGLVASEVHVLRGRLQRFRQAWRRRLRAQEALYLTPAPAVHALGAPDPLLVLFLDSGDRVLEVAPVRRWTARPAPDGARAALILRAGNPACVRAGDQLEWLRSQPRLPERTAWLEDLPSPP